MRRNGSRATRAPLAPALAACVALAAAGCAAAPEHRAAPVAPPPAPVAMVLVDDCLACHSADLLRQQRLTAKQWEKSVEKMRGWGAPTEPEETTAVLQAVAEVSPVTDVAPGAAPYVPAMLSAREAAALFARTPDGRYAGGDVARGAALYLDRCEPCHGADARGDDMGVALAGRHVLDRAEEFSALLKIGRGRMPGNDETTDAEAADLLAYLRSLPAW